MNIYPVPLQKWFPKRKKQDNSEHETCKFLVSITKCENCGGFCKWNRAWGHHSIFVGYGYI